MEAPSKRRSDCPVACVLDLLGDRWTLLVVRDLMLGRQRFQEFEGSPERIATNILSDRLRKLCAAGLATATVDPADARRVVYRLTRKGAALKGIVSEAVTWGRRYVPGTRVKMRSVGRVRPKQQ